MNNYKLRENIKLVSNVNTNYFLINLLGLSLTKTNMYDQHIGF